MLFQESISIGNYSFSFKDVLGKGVTGNVYKGLRKSDNYEVAVKVINLKQNQNQITLKLLQTQTKAIKLLKPHPNLIKTLDILRDQNFCFIITELYSGGTLKNLLQAKGRLLPEVALQIFHKIISAYCTISDCSIIHRDLKLANIMMKNDGFQPVIIDFGFAEIIQTQTIMKAFNVGSPAYMAPQAFLKTMYSEKSDIWSLGVMLYEMLVGQTLDERIQTKTYFSNISQSFINQKIMKFSGVFRQILEQTLRINPFERISCHKIKYILDKQAIMKLPNPKQGMPSSISMESSSILGLRNQNMVMNKSNFFEGPKNKADKLIYQSVNLQISNSNLQKKVEEASSGGVNKINPRKVGIESNLTAKLTESRYRTNLYSPNNKISYNSSPKNINFIQHKSNQNQLKSSSSFLHPIIHQIQSAQPFNPNNFHQNPSIRINQQFKKDPLSQIQSFPFNNIQTNQTALIPQKYHQFIYTQNPVSIVHFQSKNSNQALNLKSGLMSKNEQKKPLSSHPEKFSFKKMEQLQKDTQNQYLRPYQHMNIMNKQNNLLRPEMNQNFAKLNLNYNPQYTQRLNQNIPRNPNNRQLSNCNIYIDSFNRRII